MNDDWIATEATVTTCSYQSAGLSVLAFGFQRGERFRITFDYYAHGVLYSDEFQSAKAIPQNELISVSYNPLDPKQNSRTNRPTETTGKRFPTFALGILGSVILSLAWLAVLRGCR